MKKTSILTVLLIILGFVGAFLRAKYLMSGFETDTGLPIRSGNPYQKILLIFSICLFVFLFFFSYFAGKSKDKYDYRSIYHITSYNQVFIRVLSAFLMLVSSAAGIYLFIRNGSFSLLIVALFSLVSGAGLISLTFAQKRDSLSADHLICAAASVFWACFLLIYFYREHSASPVFGAFSYELFALAASMMALFYFSGIFFAKPYLGRSLFTSFFAIFMILTAFGGRIFYGVLSAKSIELPFAFLWYSAMASIFLLMLANCSLLNGVWHSKQ